MPHPRGLVAHPLALMSLACLLPVAPAAFAGGIECRDSKCARFVPHHDPGGEFKGEDLLWNSGTGADKRQFPPDRLVDHQHMRLEIDVPDMNSPDLTARETLTFTPIGSPLSSLLLDAVQLDIKSVASAVPGVDITWTHDGEKLALVFAPPIQPGARAEVRIDYAAHDPADGLFWTPESAQWPGRAPQIHTQGQSSTNRFWFPCHDSPNEQLTTELIVTVPEGFLVSANGRLAAPAKSAAGRTTFHWIQDKPHVNYLVSLCIGKWDVVDVGRGQMDLPVYVPPGQGPLVERCFGRTLDMVRVFEDRFGVKYPWARYAQLSVWNFGAGGMENTSATTLFDTVCMDERALLDGDRDGLISHELAHQWYGDLITCNSWADIWLNEGFATYATALWFEKRDGYDNGYLWDMHDNVRGIAARDRLDPKDANAGRRPGMASRVYHHADDVFGRTANPYPKGASVLHMLRRLLGDDVFFNGLRAYTQRFQHRTADTDDFRKVMEEVSGRSLERFFEQWVRRPGTPQVDIDAKWDDASRRLNLVVEQMQRIDSSAPAFAFDLPILIEADGSTQTIVIPVDSFRHERSIPLAKEPAMVVVDPHLNVLMTPTVKQPTRRFVEQLRRGPTLAARLDAAHALRAKDVKASHEALAALVRNTSEHYSLRQKAAESLGALKQEAALISLLQTVNDDARVRRAVVAGLGAAGAVGGAAAEALARVCASEQESYRVRAEALDGLGAIGTRDHLKVIVTALESPSQDEAIRSAALGALADLDEPEGLDAAIRFTRPGWLSRLRPDAIRAVGELGSHDKDKACDAILPLLCDHEARTRAAAARALVEIKCDKAVAELRRLAESARDPLHCELCGDCADRLLAAIAKGDSAEDVRAELNRVRRDVERLKATKSERDKEMEDK